MELLYLWIEKHKNIKKQGFNFSSKFKCHYDEMNKELTTTKREKHLENFFGENINITAIAGENGTGKSSILECLDIIFKNTENIELGYTNGDVIYPINFVLVLNINDEICYLSNMPIDITKLEEAQIMGHFDFYTYKASQQYPKDDTNKISLNETSIGKMITSSFVNQIDFKLSTFMYIPKTIEIRPLSLLEVYNDIREGEDDFPLDFNFDPGASDKTQDRQLRDSRNNMFARQDSLTSLFENANDEYHRFLLIWYIHEYGYNDNDYLLEDKTFLIGEYEQYHLENMITEEEYKQYFCDRSLSTDELTDRELDIYFIQYSEYFHFDYIDSENRRFSDLSHGEQTIFGQLLNIYFYSISTLEIETLLLFFDEPDLALHPQWQKMYLFELITLMKKINKSFQFLCTTHSPFVLSDLPRENIIFLQQDENGMCVNVTEEIEIDSFGANIHTLLSHGFFMCDGLMGGFAKKKISKILNFLGGERDTIDIPQNQIRPTIEKIGEVVIREKLLMMYEEKFPISNEQKISELENEIQRLKNVQT